MVTSLYLSDETIKEIDSICKLTGVNRSQLIRIFVDYIYQAQIEKKEWPLEGFMEKYHITAEALGIICDKSYEEINYIKMYDFFRALERSE